MNVVRTVRRPPPGAPGGPPVDHPPEPPMPPEEHPPARPAWRSVSRGKKLKKPPPVPARPDSGPGPGPGPGHGHGPGTDPRRQVSSWATWQREFFDEKYSIDVPDIYR